MCKANGKQWKDYRESDRCQLYLDALESVAGISVHALVESRSGGAAGGGTWVHPQVAVELARWISAPFAVWMAGWFLESVQQVPAASVETPPPRLREVEVIALVERSISLLERLGGLDQRDQLLFKDIVRSNVLTASSGLLPGPPPTTSCPSAMPGWRCFRKCCRAPSTVRPGCWWPRHTGQILARSRRCGSSSLMGPRVR